jgi:hypothetical protein
MDTNNANNGSIFVIIRVHSWSFAAQNSMFKNGPEAPPWMATQNGEAVLLMDAPPWMAAVSQVWSFAAQNSMFKNGTEAVFEQRNAIEAEILFAAGKKIGAESAVPAGAGAGGHAPKNAATGQKGFFRGYWGLWVWRL